MGSIVSASVLALAAALTLAPTVVADWGAGACTDVADVDFHNPWGPSAYVGVDAESPGYGVNLSHDAQEADCG